MKTCQDCFGHGKDYFGGKCKKCEGTGLKLPDYRVDDDWSDVPDSKKGALDVQEGGDHYKKQKIQPIEYIDANKLDYMQGCVVKYITRHKDKNGAEDIRKIKHYCDLILELQYGQESS